MMNRNHIFLCPLASVTFAAIAYAAGFNPSDLKADKFWETEEYHQLYYKANKGKPYCHSYKKLF